MRGELDNLEFRGVGRSKVYEMTERRLVSLIRNPDAATLLLGVVIGLAVCAPLLGGERVFLLDWSLGPHVAVATSAALGLNGGLTTGVVASTVMALLNPLLGGAATWLPILVFFPIATVGAGRLASRSRWSRIAAGALYAVNPFVFNRVFVGHLPLLIGYALLPFATAAALRSIASPVVRWSVPALWWATLTSLSPHFAWIYGLVVVGVVVVAVVTRQHSTGRAVGWFAVVVGAFTLMSTYIILPHAVTNLPTQVGSISLALYRTTSDLHLGLFVNVMSLYGFWRTAPGPELPKNIVTGWPFFMLAIFLIAAYGAWSVVRGAEPRRDRQSRDDSSGSQSRDDSSGSTSPQRGAVPEVPRHEESLAGDSAKVDQRRLAYVLLFVGVVGYFLALGDQGPTGGLFLWAYDHVPFFAVMREPQKFLMLLALAYAVLFGWGVERLSQVTFSSRVGVRTTALILGVLLPLGYTATIFGGLDGQIAPSAMPGAYQRADALMGTGPGNILYLPWHLYMEYPFTNGRVIADVGPTTFRRSVISGDNVQSGDDYTQSTSPRSAYLQQLFGSAATVHTFGALVAPLGVRYVVLAKTVDWASYSWLASQRDLKLVLDTPAIEVWRNSAYLGVGQRVTKLTSVSGLDGLLSLARSNELGAGAVVTRSGATSSSDSSTAPTGPASAGFSAKPPAVRQLSPVAYRIAAGTPGWVTVDAQYERGWSLNGHSATATAEGTVLVRVGAQGGVLRFTPWGMVRLGYIVSGGVFAAMVAILVVERRRRTRNGIRTGRNARESENAE